MLVNDHEAFLKKLQRYAPEATREGFLSTQGSQDGQREGQRTGANEQGLQGQQNQQSGSNQQNQQRGRGVQPAGGQVAPGGIQQTAGVQGPLMIDGGMLIAMDRELAENCIRETKEELNKKDGNRFDTAFIGLQIAKHAEMKNKLAVFGRHATGDLREVFAQGRETTEKHMQKAEEIMKKLNKSFETHVYEGAGHGFMRQQNADGTPNNKAAKAAWPVAMKFLTDHTKADVKP